MYLFYRFVFDLFKLRLTIFGLRMISSSCMEFMLIVTVLCNECVYGSALFGGTHVHSNTDLSPLVLLTASLMQLKTQVLLYI